MRPSCALSTQWRTFLIALTLSMVSIAGISSFAAAALVISPGTAIDVPVGGFVETIITGGSGSYSASSNDPEIAAIGMSQSKMIVTGIKAGKTTVTIQDANFSDIATLAVRVVEALSVSPSSLIMNVGEFGIITINGGTEPYTALSNDPAVSVWVSGASGDTFALTASAQGNTTVTVTDSSSPALSVDVKITVNPLSASTGSLQIVAGESETITLIGGKAPYSVFSADTAVAEATISGSSATVNGVAAGLTSITVSDSDTPPKSVVVAVKVISKLLLEPKDRDVVWYDGTSNTLQFTFKTVAGAQAYLLNLGLKDILLQSDSEFSILLMDASQAAGSTGVASADLTINTASGTASAGIPLDSDLWSLLGLFDITWNISALSSSSDLSNPMVTSESRRVKISSSVGSVKLQTPSPYAVFDKSADDAPFFSWSAHPGALSYDLFITDLSGNTVSGTMNLPSASYQLPDADFQNLSTGTWYWGVLALDANGDSVSSGYTIFNFEVE